MYMNLEWLKRRPIFGGWRGWLLPICRPTLIIRGSMGGRDMGVQPRCQQPTKTFLKWSEMNLQLKIILEIVGLARIGRIQDLFSEKLRGTPIWSSEFDVPSTIHSGKLHLAMGNDGLHPAGMVARWPGYVSPAAGSLNCSRLGWHGLSAVISCSLGPWKGQKLLSFSDFGMEWNDPCKRWVCGNWCKFITSCQVTSSRFFDWNVLKHSEELRKQLKILWLVVWNINFIFPYLGFLIIPIDFHIFQRVGPGPPSSTEGSKCAAALIPMDSRWLLGSSRPSAPRLLTMGWSQSPVKFLKTRLDLGPIIDMPQVVQQRPSR